MIYVLIAVCTLVNFSKSKNSKIYLWILKYVAIKTNFTQRRKIAVVHLYSQFSRAILIRSVICLLITRTLTFADYLDFLGFLGLALVTYNCRNPRESNVMLLFMCTTSPSLGQAKVLRGIEISRLGWILISRLLL